MNHKDAVHVQWVRDCVAKDKLLSPEMYRIGIERVKVTKSLHLEFDHDVYGLGSEQEQEDELEGEDESAQNTKIFVDAEGNALEFFLTLGPHRNKARLYIEVLLI